MADKQRLPKMQFRTNIPERLVFPYGNARRTPSQNPEWADSFMYSVEDEEGNTRAWFASQYAHDLLVQNGVGKGAIVDVTKGEEPGQGGKMRVTWHVDVIDPGTPVPQPVSNPATQAERPSAGGAAPAAAPGSRSGAEGRLGELGAAYAACVDEAKGVWMRSSQGLPGKLDHETIHSTASSFFIALTREGYDLGVFANTYSESEGLRTLRKLIERTRTEPHLEDVREHFGKQLDSMPTNPAEQRRLYASLVAAVKTATQLAAANTPPDDGPPDEEFPVDMSDLRRDIPDPKPNISRARKPDPKWLASMLDKAESLWGDETEASLGQLIMKVTRSKEPIEARDLTDAQATTVLRTLDNSLARQHTQA